MLLLIWVMSRSREGILGGSGCWRSPGWKWKIHQGCWLRFGERCVCRGRGGDGGIGRGYGGGVERGLEGRGGLSGGEW